MGDSVKDKEQMNERDKGPCVKQDTSYTPPRHELQAPPVAQDGQRMNSVSSPFSTSLAGWAAYLFFASSEPNQAPAGA